MKGKLVVLSITVLVFVLSSMSFSQSKIGLMGVGGRVGLVMPEGDIENTIGFGANADLGTLMPNLKLFAYFDFWTKGYDVGPDLSLSWSSIGISAVAKYELAMEGNLKPYFGGGLGFNISRRSSDYKGLYSSYYTDTSDSDFDVALHFLGGASMPLSSNLDGFGELRYTLDGVDYFGIYVGVSYKLK